MYTCNIIYDAIYIMNINVCIFCHVYMSMSCTVVDQLTIQYCQDSVCTTNSHAKYINF